MRGHGSHHQSEVRTEIQGRHLRLDCLHRLHRPNLIHLEEKGTRDFISIL